MPELLEPTRYTLRFPAPYTHYVEVEAALPTSGKPGIELAMAVWTPGSYLVREYARHVEGLMAHTPDGTGLSLDKSRKNRWRIHTNDAQTIVVTYRVYCREMSVRTNWVEDSFALLNGASTFLTLVEDVARPHDVHLLLPDAWQTSCHWSPRSARWGSASLPRCRFRHTCRLADSRWQSRRVHVRSRRAPPLSGQ